MKPANVFTLVALAALWGGSFLFMRVSAPVFGPVLLTGTRIGIAALVVTLAALAWRKPLAVSGHWRFYLFVGLLNSALPFLLFAYAAQSLSASFMSILNSMTPICGAVVSSVWLRTPVTTSLVIGLLMGVGGVTYLVADESAATGSAGMLGPVAASLFATLCYAISGTYVKIKEGTVDPLSGANGCLWTATLFLLPLMSVSSANRTPTPEAWGALIVLGALCTGAAYIVYFRLLQEEGPVRTLSVAFLVPLFGVLWGVLFLDEPFRWTMVAGALLVLTGTALTNGLIKLSAARS